MKRKTAVFVLTLALAGAMFMTGCGSNSGVEADLVANIEKYCQEQGIAIPVLEECEDCELEEVE